MVGQQNKRYAESSSSLGVGLLSFGLLTWVGNYYLTIFTTWLAAIVFGGVMVTLGVLFLYPDVRLYQYESSPLEELIVNDQSD